METEELTKWVQVLLMAMQRQADDIVELQKIVSDLMDKK